jgi:hypothetical protein
MPPGRKTGGRKGRNPQQAQEEALARVEATTKRTRLEFALACMNDPSFPPGFCPDAMNAATPEPAATPRWHAAACRAAKACLATRCRAAWARRRQLLHLPSPLPIRPRPRLAPADPHAGWRWDANGRRISPKFRSAFAWTKNYERPRGSHWSD